MGSAVSGAALSWRVSRMRSVRLATSISAGPPAAECSHDSTPPGPQSGKRNPISGRRSLSGPALRRLRMVMLICEPKPAPKRKVYSTG